MQCHGFLTTIQNQNQTNFGSRRTSTVKACSTGFWILGAIDSKFKFNSHVVFITTITNIETDTFISYLNVSTVSVFGAGPSNMLITIAPCTIYEKQFGGLSSIRIKFDSLMSSILIVSLKLFLSLQSFNAKNSSHGIWWSLIFYSPGVFSLSWATSMTFSIRDRSPSFYIEHAKNGRWFNLSNTFEPPL